MKITYYANGQIASFEGSQEDLIDVADILGHSKATTQFKKSFPSSQVKEEPYTRQQIEGWKWQPLWEKYGD